MKAVSSRFAASTSDELFTWRVTLEEIKEAEPDGDNDDVGGADGQVD